jgi:hypothetical protein
MHKHFLFRFTVIISIALFCLTCQQKESEPPLVQTIDSPAAFESAEPFLFTAEDGMVYLSWIKETDKKSEMFFSKLMDGGWSTPAHIDSGSTWFVNWADYPMMAINKNNFIASYLDKSGVGTYSYDVKIKTSSDKGNTWSKSNLLNEDGKEAEHGFTSFIPYGDNFFVSWLDGRNAAMEDMSDHHSEDHGSMSLRGAILDGTGKKLQDWELDPKTCDCCNTCSALTEKGPIVVYRDRSDEEVRDISIVRWVDRKWTAPKTIFDDRWMIKGCPVNGPRIVANGNRAAVAWFSRPNNKPEVKVAFSHNSGESFEHPIRIDQDKPIGRIDLEMLEDGSVFVLWMERAVIMGARVGEHGIEWSVPISASSEARSSGFPQVTRSGKLLVLAWTDDQQKSIKTAAIKL